MEAAGLILLLLFAPPPDAELRRLTEGVSKIGVPGLPGLLSVFGAKAFPVVVAPSAGGSAAVVGAAQAKRGRIVLFAHDGYLGDVLREADTGRLMENVIRWAAGRGKRLVVGLRGEPGLASFLGARGIESRSLDVQGWASQLRDIDVLCLSPRELSDAELGDLRAYLEGGGGIVSGVTGWGWEQLHPGRSLSADCSINRLTAPYGLVIGGGTIDVPGSRQITLGEIPDAAHAEKALDLLAAGKGEAPLAVATLSRCLRDLPPDDDLLLPRIKKLLRGAKRKLPPLTNRDGLAKVLIAYEWIHGKATDASPAAAQFPGAVPPGAATVCRVVPVETTCACWTSTGLYAAPGALVKATVPAGGATGLSLRIGAHTDRLWDKAEWNRAPEISRSIPLGPGANELANPFGGLVYVETGGAGSGGRIEVRIDGCVEAPFYRLGETTAEQWNRQKRAPGPWGELATSKVILTLPSEVLRGLADPGPLMIFWDKVLDGAADLAARPRERERPERYLTDMQISAGYMHSGYPIMTHLDAVPRFADLATLESRGDWGMFHELGHNHQQPDWTFDGTVEVTCNLFSLYLIEVVCKDGQLHEALAPAQRKAVLARHRASGCSFDGWKSQPFLALLSYMQLREAFGWETYKKLFAEYRALKPDERPKNDEEKRDQWMVRFSRAVGKNLGPFFEAWGIPTSKAARDSIASLAPWLPPEMK